MDFMFDSLSDGRSLRNFNVIDDYNRECLTVDVDIVMQSLRVIPALEQVMEWRGKPAALRCDHAPEYVSGALVNWANQYQIILLYIQPDNPTQNASVERFNRTARHEWLGLHDFDSASTHKSLRLSGNDSTTMNGRTPQSEVSRHGGYYRPHNPQFLAAV